MSRGNQRPGALHLVSFAIEFPLANTLCRAAELYGLQRSDLSLTLFYVTKQEQKLFMAIREAATEEVFWSTISISSQSLALIIATIVQTAIADPVVYELVLENPRLYLETYIESINE